MCKTNQDNIKKSRNTATPLSNKKYKDAPRFKVIYGYEDAFKLEFKKSLINMQKELIDKMIEMKPQ